MNIARYLSPERIQLGMRHGHLDDIDPEANPRKERERLKDEVIDELVALFDRSEQILNLSKFRRDFVNRERADSTGLPGGVALPHIRTRQARQTVIVLARSRDGVWFDAMDQAPTHLFFGITAPEWDDREFYRFHKWIAAAFVQEEWLADALLYAGDEHEILRILGSLP